jgi:hypothetical protein
MATANSVGDRRSRCQRQLLGLRMLVMGQDGIRPRQAAEVQEATNAVIAEAETMSRALAKAGGREPGTETFLWVRVARLTMAADDAVNAARDGDRAELDAHLRHFEALTSAMWAVQDAMRGHEPAGSRS